ncbi:MAG TPA: hypothetical protein VM888_08615 [Chitinophagaceae bacterium]|nr:hypothetical protein [Chitinophagaceae bacterium]
MNPAAKTNKFTATYILVLFVAAILTWLLHEWAHWLTGTLLGNKMVMTLNTSYPISKFYEEKGDKYLVDMAGPLITLMQAIIVFILMKYRNIKWLYPFLFVCFYIRLLAACLSFLNPNDEARVSKGLGLGTFTLPLLMVSILFFLIYSTSQRYHFSKKFNLVNLAFIILFTSVIILSDQFFHITLL